MHGKVICHAHCPDGGGFLLAAVLGVVGIASATALVMAHLVLVAVDLGVLAAVSAALAVLSRVLRSHCLVVGRARVLGTMPAAVPAIEHRAPLAIEPPRTFVAGQVIDDPAYVVINGTKYEVLSKD